MIRPARIVLIVAFSSLITACSSEKSAASSGGLDAMAAGGASGTADAAVASDGAPAGGQGPADVAAGGKGGSDAGIADGRASNDGHTGGAGGRASGGAGGTSMGGASTGGRSPAGGSAGNGSGGAAGRSTGGQAVGGTGGRSTSAPGGTGGTGTGGRNTTGTAGRATGGQGTAGTAGATTSGTGGQSTGGVASGPKILWTDGIQSKPSPWGLDGFGVEHPIGTSVTASDANGANFSVVPDPLGGTGLAIRHYATFDTGGSRSQGGLYSDVNTVFGKQAKSPEGVWIAQEWYFPEALSANGDAYCWINLWDFHSVDGERGNRWHTSPGLMLAQDGSMKVRWEWGGPAYNINKGSGLSAVAMPVGRWFDIEMHYVWTDSPDGTITLWIDGQQALEQTGVQTRDSMHQIAETYLKFYGSTQGRGPWTPTPSLKYTRNVRVAGERIWRAPAVRL